MKTSSYFLDRPSTKIKIKKGTGIALEIPQNCPAIYCPYTVLKNVCPRHVLSQQKTAQRDKQRPPTCHALPNRNFSHRALLRRSEYQIGSRRTAGHDGQIQCLCDAPGRKGADCSDLRERMRGTQRRTEPFNGSSNGGRSRSTAPPTADGSAECSCRTVPRCLPRSLTSHLPRSPVGLRLGTDRGR